MKAKSICLKVKTQCHLRESHQKLMEVNWWKRLILDLHQRFLRRDYNTTTAIWRNREWDFQFEKGRYSHVSYKGTFKLSFMICKISINRCRKCNKSQWLWYLVWDNNEIFQVWNKILFQKHPIGRMNRYTSLILEIWFHWLNFHISLHSIAFQILFDTDIWLGVCTFLHFAKNISCLSMFVSYKWPHKELYYISNY